MTEEKNNIARLLGGSILALSVKKLTNIVRQLKITFSIHEAILEERSRRDQAYREGWMEEAPEEVAINIIETCLWARKVMENVGGKEGLKSKYNHEIESVEYRLHQIGKGEANKGGSPHKIELRDLLNRIIHAEIMRALTGPPKVKPSYLLVESDRRPPIEVYYWDFIKGLESLCLSENLILSILLDKAVDRLAKPIQREDMLGPRVMEKSAFIQQILRCTEGGEIIRQHYLKKTGENITDYESPGEIRSSTIGLCSGQMVMSIDNGDIFIELPLAEALGILRQNYPLRITKHS